MSYKITFTDRTVILVDTKTGDDIKAMQMEVPAPNYFSANMNGAENVYKLDKVNKIEWQPDQPTTRELSEGSRCHGQHSIHMVIYEAYRKKIGKGEKADWKEFRQKTYDWLYEKYPNREWCDNRKGTCFCESKAVERVKEIMGGGEVIA